MPKEKKIKEIKKFTLSETAINFIKKFVLTELNISAPIDENKLDDILKLAAQWEISMIDPLSVDGCDKSYDYPERERNEAADEFVSEITGQWDDDALIPDFYDLNVRLGLL